MIHTISTFPKDPSIDSKGIGLLADAKEFLQIKTIEKIKCVKKFYLEGINSEDVEKLRKKVLVEDIWQDYVIDKDFYENHPHRIEIAYKPGMMNPEVRSLLETANALGIKNLKAADTCWVYYFEGKNINSKEINEVIEKLIMNSLIEDIRSETPSTLIITGNLGKIKTIGIRHMNNDELMELSANTLFLTLTEMQTIKKYFQKENRDPYDAELEILAQTWSEHCVHKTFKAKLKIDGKETIPLYKRLKDATKEINHPNVVSAFVDNSGVWKFDNKYGICAKAETHNSPSALDPFGGAATGSGGVFRDIVGTGKGAKVIAGTDIFCLGNPNMNSKDIPKGCKHPRFILKGVVRGVGYYGNPMGIPTVNGSFHFHQDFRCKPTVLVGAYGLIELDKAQKGTPQKNDLIMTIGGKTGRDGIHGATFSSAEMTDETVAINSTAVQIGDPIEEKRAFDACLELSKEELINAMTDCGAGGFSSAIGEMGEKIGVHVELEKAPLKYAGLSPWEIFISESQERMIVAINSKNLKKAQKILKKHNVEGAVLGRFTGDKKLFITHNGKILCDLPMNFVHEGLTQAELKGTTNIENFKNPNEQELQQNNYTNVIKNIMSNYNVCSKESIIRRYDHNVQGTAVQMPLAGDTHSAPNNASVLEPIPDNGKGVVISHGLNPILNRINPYKGSKWAIMEAISNAVSQGADPQNMALLDNFIWPKPNEKFLADLSHSVDACVELSKAFRMPFISGKDSLSSTYKKSELTIHIPPVLCVSAISVIDDIKKTISSPFKKAGNKIVLIGETKPEMGGSIYYENLGYTGSEVPEIETKKAFQTFKNIHEGIKQGIIKSCQDISEGGLATMIAEMCFGKLFGAEIILNKNLTDYVQLFSESPGRFICEVSSEDVVKLQKICKNISCQIIGQITNRDEIIFKNDKQTLIQIKTSNLMKIWQAPMEKIF